MKLRSKTMRQRLERLKARIGVDGLFRKLGDDLPLRSEMFSVAQLERHAEALAVESFTRAISEAARRFMEKPTGTPLIPNWNRVTAAVPGMTQT